MLKLKKIDKLKCLFFLICYGNRKISLQIGIFELDLQQFDSNCNLLMVLLLQGIIEVFQKLVIITLRLKCF